jgi:transcriptional regulator with XRE-family HTH domain
MATVGENIFLMRKQLGWTQEELAKKMGYKSKSTINKIELGINDISQSKVIKFAEVLGTTPAYLMGWEEEHFEQAIDNILLDVLTDLSAEETIKVIAFVEGLKANR